MTDAAPDPELVELAHQMFDLARDGETERLAAYVETGVPVDLTDASGLCPRSLTRSASAPRAVSAATVAACPW